MNKLEDVLLALKINDNFLKAIFKTALFLLEEQTVQKDIAPFLSLVIK